MMMNYSMEEKQIALVMKTRCYLSDCPCDGNTSYHEESFVAYPDCSMFHFLATTNTLWTWHDECNMSLWWCCVPVILFVDGHQKVRANFFARKLQSCLGFSTSNKIGYEIFVSI